MRHLKESAKNLVNWLDDATTDGWGNRLSLGHLVGKGAVHAGMIAAYNVVGVLDFLEYRDCRRMLAQAERQDPGNPVMDYANSVVYGWKHEKHFGLSWN